MAGTQRYWNGAGWSEHVAPAVHPIQPLQQQGGVSSTVIGLGYVGAIFLPIVGFVIGIVVLVKDKNEQTHGVIMMVISVVVTAIAFNSLADSYSY